MVRFKVTVLSCSLLVTSGAWGISPEDKCEADKNKIAGKYAFCRQKAEMKAIKKDEPADYSKCDSKLLLKWQKAEEKAVKKGTTCMDAVADTDIQSFVTAHADAVAAALDGGALPECGDGSLNAFGEQCDGADLGGETCETLGLERRNAGLRRYAAHSILRGAAQLVEAEPSLHRGRRRRLRGIRVGRRRPSRAARCRTPTTATARSRTTTPGSCGRSWTTTGSVPAARRR